MNTLGEKYGPAMEITDQDAADVYFDLLVKDTMAKHGMDRDAAGEQERRNLGYYAGYYKQETRKRVEKLFACSHPIFGEVARNGTPHQRRARTLGARTFQAVQDHYKLRDAQRRIAVLEQQINQR